MQSFVRWHHGPRASTKQQHNFCNLIFSNNGHKSFKIVTSFTKQRLENIIFWVLQSAWNVLQYNHIVKESKLITCNGKWHQMAREVLQPHLYTSDMWSKYLHPCIAATYTLCHECTFNLVMQLQGDFKSK